DSYNRAKDGGNFDDAAKLLADMVAMGGQIGLSPKQPSL
ncbi:MAG: F0F1 ATP synthase subunit epsilon, partial [Pseudomonadota bacterium]